MTFVRALGSLLALMLAASACSSEQDASASEAAPFDAILIELFGTDDTEAYLVDTERRAAELVVSCMEEAGFAFEIPPATPQPAVPDPGNIERARADGFGIISGFRFQLSQTDLDAQRGPDPNVAYLSTLTAAEIDRFFFTLDGPEAEPGQRRESGCNVEASEQAYAEWNAFLGALPNYTSLAEERDTHPDWLAARAVWRDCMVDRGFDYSEPEAIRTDVISRMRETVGEIYPDGQLPLVQIDGGFAVDPTVDGLLDELVQFEQAAAVANIECTAPVAETFDVVERRVQQEFIDRHRATIDALLDTSS